MIRPTHKHQEVPLCHTLLECFRRGFFWGVTGTGRSLFVPVTPPPQAPQPRRGWGCGGNPNLQQCSLGVFAGGVLLLSTSSPCSTKPLHINASHTHWPAPADSLILNPLPSPRYPPHPAPQDRRASNSAPAGPAEYFPARKFYAAQETQRDERRRVWL